MSRGLLRGWAWIGGMTCGAAIALAVVGRGSFVGLGLLLGVAFVIELATRKERDA